MWKLVPIYIVTLLLAFFSQRNSTYRLDVWGEKEYAYREKLIFFIMSFMLAIFVGLRTMGNDTYTYRMMFENGIKGGMEGFTSINWLNISGAPGLQFVEVLLKTIGATTQDYFMVCALFTVITYLWFIHKYTSDIWLSIYYFLTMGVYTFTMAAIKQTMAVAILLIATDRAIQKKNVQFVIGVLIAELFHPYAFIYLIVPFLFFVPWTRKSHLLICGTVIISLGLSRFMSGILLMTESLGYSYDVNEFTGEGVNVFRVFVVWVPVLISFLGRKQLQNNSDRINNLFINLSMVNALIMFIGLFGTANYFARLANYFLIFQTLSLPWSIRLFTKESKKLVIIASIFCYALYNYYGTVIANGAFDQQYDFITLKEFLVQLF